MNFKHHYSSHMIFQKSFWYYDLLLQKHLLLWWKQVSIIYSGFFDEQKVQKNIIDLK